MIARLTLWDTIGAFLTRSQPKAPGAAPGLSLTSLGHRKAPNQEASEGVGPSVTTRGALPMESRQAAPEHQRGQWLPKDQYYERGNRGVGRSLGILGRKIGRVPRRARGRGHRGRLPRLPQRCRRACQATRRRRIRDRGARVKKAPPGRGSVFTFPVVWESSEPTRPYLQTRVS